MSKALCCYAFETLVTKLELEPAKLPLKAYLKALKEDPQGIPESAPLFITWRQHSDLRGCIGTFSAMPIESGVSRFTVSSAFQDPRFPPIDRAEAPNLEVDVTLLDNFRPIKNAEDWTIGLNGLKISFDIDDEHFSGTFLPSVAQDENWDKLTTLYYLLRKAGYAVAKGKVADFYAKGLQEDWMKLTKYDGLKAHLGYDEFVKIRNKIQG
ncbi:uncharacterized protein LODBEIA_P45690 [Lodderomyces beijingensis]|uniref:AMMECR1 domain-containing protein n=1 Tax=Lodderomyces beijingensis TaxID=1775926 RepID=A0ABP0ZQB0_9ASCO